MAAVDAQRGTCIFMWDNGDGSISIAKGHADSLHVTTDEWSTQLGIDMRVFEITTTMKPNDWVEEQALPAPVKGLLSDTG